jgi:hypothetical protein
MATLTKQIILKVLRSKRPKDQWYEDLADQLVEALSRTANKQYVEVLREMVLDMDHECKGSPAKRKAEKLIAEYDEEH